MASPSLHMRGVSTPQLVLAREASAAKRLSSSPDLGSWTLGHLSEMPAHPGDLGQSITNRPQPELIPRTGLELSGFAANAARGWTNLGVETELLWGAARALIEEYAARPD